MIIAEMLRARSCLFQLVVGNLSTAGFAEPSISALSLRPSVQLLTLLTPCRESTVACGLGGAKSSGIVTPTGILFQLDSSGERGDSGFCTLVIQCVFRNIFGVIHGFAST